MADESQTSGIQRIEAALRRLESALARRPAPAGDEAALRTEHEALRHRYGELEARAQAALDSLDQLIGKLEPR